MENKLRQAGFTDKEIDFIHKWSGREKTPFHVVIKELYRVFVGVSIILIVLSFVAVYEFFHHDDFTGFFIGYLFAVLLFFIFAPMKLGAKVFLFIRKNGNSYL